MQRRFKYLPKPASVFDKIFGVRKARQQRDDDDDDDWRDDDTENGDDRDDRDDDGDGGPLGELPHTTDMERSPLGAYYWTTKGDGLDNLGHLAKVTTALMVAHPGLTPQRALNFILHHPNGRALVRSLYKRHGGYRPATRKESPTDRDQQITALAKQHGALAVCKHFVAGNDTHGFSEHEITKMILDSVERRPAESREMAFARVYQSEDGLVYRKAIALANKAFPTQAVVTPLVTAGSAYDQLLTKAEVIRKANPALTKAQAFEKAYLDPDNAALAAKEREQNRPSAG